MILSLTASHLYEYNYLSFQTENFKHIFHYYQKLQCCLYDFHSSIMYDIGLLEINESLQWILYMIIVNQTSYSVVQIWGGGGGIHTSNKFYIFYEENLLILCHLKTLWICMYANVCVCVDSSCLNMQR